MAVAVFRAVDYHAEAAVYYFAPAYAAAVVDAHPGGAAEAVADNVLHGHIGSELRAVVDVGCLTEGGVRAGDVMMVAAQDDGSGDFAFADGFVEGEGNLGAAFAIGIKNARLAAHDEVVAAGFFDPVDVVAHLAGDFLGGVGCDFGQYLNGQGV